MFIHKAKLFFPHIFNNRDALPLSGIIFIVLIISRDLEEVMLDLKECSYWFIQFQ